MIEIKKISLTFKLVIFYFLIATFVSLIKNERFLSAIDFKENVFFIHLVAHLSSMVNIFIDFAIKGFIFFFFPIVLLSSF